MADYDSSLPIRTEANGDAAVKIVDGTVTSQTLTIDASGRLVTKIQDSAGNNLDSTGNALHISDGGGSLTVDATNLDIRDLDSAQDSVEAVQATHDNLNLNANLQVGDADVANGNPVPVSDAGGSLTVDANNLDIRDLTHVSDSVKVGDGTDLLAVNTDGSINVVVQEDTGTEIVNYDTSAAVAAGASDNHDWTSAAASKLYQVYASASGKMKIEIQIETGAATNTFNTIAVGFNSASDNNIDVNLAKYAAVPNGARVRVIRTNRDNQAMDVYSTIVAIQG